MKNYNIFLIENDQKELNKLKKQYHLSNSCIIRQIYNCTLTWCNKQLEEKLLFDIRISKRTSINTNFKKYLFLNYENQNINKIQTVISNCIYLYFRKETLGQLTKTSGETLDRIYKTYHNSLHAMLKTEKDKFYNYQEYALNEARAKREFKRKGK